MCQFNYELVELQYAAFTAQAKVLQKRDVKVLAKGAIAAPRLLPETPRPACFINLSNAKVDLQMPPGKSALTPATVIVLRD